MNLLPGHEHCGIAIGIMNEATFGSGELNEHGYWQHPCELCAREWEKKNPDGGHAWPFTEKYVKHMGRKIHKDVKNEEDEKFMQEGCCDDSQEIKESNEGDQMDLC